MAWPYYWGSLTSHGKQDNCQTIGRPPFWYPYWRRTNQKSAPSSYRPISLTSCIGKRVERMINERLNWWLEHNNIITPWQAGFRSNYATEDQLIRLTQYIHNWFQLNKDTIAVFVDLEKVYDKIWRQGLFIKMRDAGMYRWISNFLTDRTIATQNRRNDISKRVTQGRDTTRQRTQLHPLHAVYQWHCEVLPRHTYNPLCRWPCALVNQRKHVQCTSQRQHKPA